ncbi:MAG TPA: response regulator [Mycobacteriales bacterium]|nr:response regulator [Mycobacteriales bacterium]
MLVADGNASLAAVLTDLLADEPGFDVVGTALQGGEALEMARQRDPDLLLVDERLDGGLAPDLLGALRTTCPRAAVLLWSHHAVHTAAPDVDGVLPRGLPFRDLVRELRDVLRSHRSQDDRSTV